MKLFFKRLGAYVIDILLVSIIAAIISNIGTINYQKDKYLSTYDKAIKITEKYQNREIEKDEYTKELSKISYKLEKNSSISTIISIAVLLGYFGIFQYSKNGKTLGKKIFKLQIVKTKNDLNLINFLLRSLILNNIIFNISKLILLYTLNQNTYMNISSYITNIQMIFQLLIIVSMLISKEGRGIHDYIAGTKVIDLKEEDEFTKGTRKVIEGEIIK